MAGQRFKVSVNVRIEQLDQHGNWMGNQIMTSEDFMMDASSFTELAQVLGRFNELAEQIGREMRGEEPSF